MNDYVDSINLHYGPSDISARIMAGLREAGKDLHRLTREDLAPFDEFHGGGRASTRELAGLASLRPGMSVLDVGSGVGGPARTLAAEFGCRVTGIDLTEEFCRAAAWLTEKVGLSELARFCCGNALALPFAENAFDVVWSQNALMNIEDRVALVRQVHRVLRPGGMFAFEAVFAGTVPDLQFPVFWASSPALSFLVTPGEARALLTAASLQERIWEDTTQRSIANQRQRQEAIARDGLPKVGLNLIVPADVAAKIENGLRNNETGRTVTAQAVYVK